MEIRMLYRHVLNGRLLKGGRIYSDIPDSDAHDLVQRQLAVYEGAPAAEVREKKVKTDIEKR